MKTKLLKKYGKHFALMLFLSLNICINFTSDGISIGLKQVCAQEGVWDTGYEWFDDFMNSYWDTPGTYFNDGNGNWSYCLDCAYHINLNEVIIKGTNMSNTPVNTSISDIWHSVPASGGSEWSYWDYSGEVWQNFGGGTPPPPPPPADDIFNPYNTIYHNSDKQQVSTEWYNDNFAEFGYKIIYGIVIQYFLDVWETIISAFVDVYLDNSGNIINPELTIMHKITNFYVPTYNWSGKVTVATVNHTICNIEEYSDSFNVNRQVGPALYESRIVNKTTNQVLSELWSGETGFSGSVEDCRCGKPQVGQHLFSTCIP